MGSILIPCKLEIEPHEDYTNITLSANLTKPLIVSFIFGTLLASLFMLIYKIPLASIAALIFTGGIFFGILYIDISKRANRYLNAIIED